MKFKNLKPGMEVYDLRKHLMGHTTIYTISLYRVKIFDVDQEKRQFTYSWNGNRPETGTELTCEKWRKNKPLLVKSPMGYSRLATREEIAEHKAKLSATPAP